MEIIRVECTDKDFVDLLLVSTGKSKMYANLRTQKLYPPIFDSESIAVLRLCKYAVTNRRRIIGYRVEFDGNGQPLIEEEILYDP